MSYDLYFVPAEFGLDIEAAAAYFEREWDEITPVSEELVAALLLVGPELQRFEFEDEPAAEGGVGRIVEHESALNRVELNGSESTGIQVTLFPDQASITVPFWHDAVMAIEVFEEVARYATVLVERGGYRIFDPQLERVAERFESLELELLAAYSATVVRE